MIEVEVIKLLEFRKTVIHCNSKFFIVQPFPLIISVQPLALSKAGVWPARSGNPGRWRVKP